MILQGCLWVRVHSYPQRALRRHLWEDCGADCKEGRRQYTALRHSYDCFLCFRLPIILVDHHGTCVEQELGQDEVLANYASAAVRPGHDLRSGRRVVRLLKVQVSRRGWKP